MNDEARLKQALASCRAENQQLREALAQQYNFSRAKDDMACLTLLEEQSEEILRKTARILGQTLDIERVHISKVDYAQGVVFGLAEWLNPDKAEVETAKGDLPLSMFQSAHEYLLANRSNMSSHAYEPHPLLVADGSAQVLHGDFKVKSLLWHPFDFNEGYYHILVLNQVSEVRNWTTLECNFMESLTYQVSLALQKLQLLEQRSAFEAKLQAERSVYKTIVDYIPIMITRHTPVDNLLYVNNFWEKRLGWTEAELQAGDPPTMLYPDPEIQQKALKHIYEATGEWQLFEARTKQGTKLSIDWANVRLPDGSQLGIGIDVSERQASERAIRESELKFRTLFETMPTGITIADETGQILSANQAAEHILGLSTPEHERLKVDDEQNWAIIRPDGSRMPAEEYAAVRALKEQRPVYGVEMGVPRPDGQLAWLIVNAAPLPGIGVVVSYQDISPLKAAQEATRQSEAHLRQITENMGEVFWLRSADNQKILYINPAYERIFGRSCESLYEDADSFLEPILEEDIPLATRAYQNETYRKTGRLNVEYRIRRPDGEIRWINAKSFPVLDEQGKIISYTGVAVDITERKREAALRQAQEVAEAKSRAKSEFLANMSHEIRTPLNGVIGFADLLLRTPLDNVQKQYADNINTSGRALLGIINDILDFSKIEAGKLELELIWVDLVEILEETTDIIKFHAAEKGLELLLNIPADMPRIAYIDPVRLKQILINLLSNAVKFTSAGEVELKVEYQVLDEAQGRLRFSVRDTGIGISQHQQDKLFKAFSQVDSSTTRRFGGTGLGLVISHLLAEKMGSQIQVQSQMEEGSTFYFEIQVGLKAADQNQAPKQALPIHKVLVIDDNANNRLILEHNLRHWGLQYRGCENGFEALDLLKAEHFDLLIVDYHMPGMDGLETIRRIKQLFAGLNNQPSPIILLHSSADDYRITEQCRELGVRFNLIKPVKASELYHFIHNLSATAPNPVPPKTTAQSPELELAKDYSAYTVLLAEDVPVNMLLLKKILERHCPGLKLIEAIHGKEALEKAKIYPIDLIIMDVQMPEMDGLEASRLIRQLPDARKAQIPIIALTAGALREEMERALAAGMNDFLTKPIEREKLLQLIKHYLIENVNQNDN